MEGDEPDSKVVGDEENVPEETFIAENESSDAVSVSKQGAEGETVDSEMGSKKGEEDEKTEEKDAPDSTTTVKESSSVEGDDQKKRFVAFCLLETKMAISVALAPFVVEKKLDVLLEVKLFSAFARFHLSFFTRHTPLYYPVAYSLLELITVPRIHHYITAQWNMMG